VRGAFVDLVPADVAKAIAVSAFGGFLVAQQASRRMLPNRHGAILFTGASASVKGYAQSAAFAMGKFALRGLAQSMARELSPHGIHVAHFVIDGGIRSAVRTEPPDKPDSLLDPDAIAANYWSVLSQPRSAWTSEMEMRPWLEKFQYLISFLFRDKKRYVDSGHGELPALLAMVPIVSFGCLTGLANSNYESAHERRMRIRTCSTHTIRRNCTFPSPRL
jgi:NAD(P)-dependent dehydrogenase (short-subunit alcohol dehydrogenase family)